MPMAVFMESASPTHSSTEGAPPLVISRTLRIASSPRSVTTSVAPNRRAVASRPSWRPSMMIRSAPSRLAASTPQRPTAPSPTTATTDPRSTPAETAAWCPVPITSFRGRIALSRASSPSTWGGRTTSVPSASSARIASAWPPS